MKSGLFGEIGKCLQMLPPRMRWRWWALIPLLLLAGLAELGGAAAIFWMIQSMSHAGTAAVHVPRMLARYVPSDPNRAALLFAAVLATVYTIKNLILAFATWAEVRMMTQSMYLAFRALISRFLAAPYPLHLRRNSAEFIHAASTGIDTSFRIVMFAAVGFVAEVMVVIAIIGVLFVKAPLPALGVIVLLGVILGAIVTLSRKVMMAWGAESHERSQMVQHHLQQMVGGVKEIKAFGVGDFFLEIASADEKKYLQAHAHHATLAGMPRLIIETMFVWSSFGVIAVLVSTRGIAGDTVPLLALFAYAGFRIIPSANRFVYFTDQMRYGRRAVDRVHQLWSYFGGANATLSIPPLAPALRFQRDIELEEVSFSYAGSEIPSVVDVSLRIAAGESIGIVGMTGCGKSTLVDLIAGLLEPTAGTIRFDGVAQQEWLASGRRRVGYVPQTTYLLDDTLRRNVTLGLDERNVDEERLLQALSIAQLDAFVEQLPAGLDTRVGERGVRLSGGERQRIALARAIYLDPDVLLLDEATASLDLDTEQRVNAAITKLQGRKTLVIVAHRLTSVRACDRIVVMREGRVVGVGPWEELAATNAEFRNLASRAQTEPVAAP